MVYLLLLTIPLASSTFDLPKSVVFETVEAVLVEEGIPIKVVADNQLKTEKLKIDFDLLQNYITENQPDDNPGWTRARFYLEIEIHELESGQTEIMIKAFFDRFGVRSAMVLIPPFWSSVPSNGFMEKELLDEIEKRLITARRTE